MSIEELFQSPPVSYTNLSVNSITTNNLFEFVSVNNVTTSPVTLTAEQYVGQLIFSTGGATGTINAPDDAKLQSFFLSRHELRNNLSFNVYYYRGTGTMTIQLGSGVTEYRLGASSIVLSAVASSVLRYVYNGTLGTWVVYYD